MKSRCTFPLVHLPRCIRDLQALTAGRSSYPNIQTCTRQMLTLETWNPGKNLGCQTWEAVSSSQLVSLSCLLLYINYCTYQESLCRFNIAHQGYIVLCLLCT